VRALSTRLRSALATFPVVFLTGSRQSGRTTLARTTQPDYRYISFEDLVSRHVPIEAKSGLTVAGDALDGFDRYLDLSHNAPGLLVYGGDEARSRGRHHLRPWWELN
jgi:predicted AAA+ superfamily ATPase